MDKQRFGSYIAERRKEKGMTQAMLAEKICVTDKAVSKWERGVGFPDIKTLEPLAEALDLSLGELMNGNKIDNISVTDEIDSIVSNTLELAVYQSELHMRNVLIGVAIAATLLVTIFLLDLENGPGTFLFVCLPLLVSLLGVAIVSIGFHRRKREYKAKGHFVLGIILIFFPIELYIFAWVMIIITLQ